MVLGIGRDSNHMFLYDFKWLKEYDKIKHDPYKFVLTKKEEKKLWNRPKRLMFTSVLAFGYLYKHFRYHQELSRVKNLKFTGISLISSLPKLVLIVLLSYPIGVVLYKNERKIEQSIIANYELMKFDPEYFTYNDYGYCLLNAPLYKDKDSVWGRQYYSRVLSDYYQMSGWIERRRQRNPDILLDVPPKMENHHGPRTTATKENLNQKVLTDRV